MENRKRLVIGITGASGSIFGVSALRILHGSPDWETHLVLTQSAVLTMQTELDDDVDSITALADVVHEETDVAASISSGSFQTEGMLIAPCSMKTVSGIANGFSNNLLLRTADVTIKEKRTLVILPREAPMSAIHLKNLLTLAELGVIVFPPVPAFYHKPEKLEDVIDHIIRRSLRYFGICDESHYKPWQGLN